MSTQEPGGPALPIGSVFQGTYEIVAELGTGSFGSVYRARRVGNGHDVAIKVLRLHTTATASDSITAAEQFRDEMRLTAQLWHPNIVRLVESGESTEGVLYAVFDLVPGVTLKQVLQTEGRLGMAETVHLMGQILDALSCAHAHGIVHRDLKPENIMVTCTGVRRNAIVVDFGVGALTRALGDPEPSRTPVSKELIGTPCYAAPEQLRGEEPSPRSDLYSWGLIFLECVTGEVAVTGATPEEVLMKQLNPQPIVLPPWLMQHSLGPLLRTVTTKQVERRAVTAEALMAALSTVGDVVAEPSAPRYGVAPPEGERRQLTVVSCRFSAQGDDRRFDAEDLDLLLHEQQTRCADLATRHGGQLAGIMADRVMLTFGYPHAREDDARRAVRVALAIVDQIGTHDPSERGRLAAHVGVHTGVVIVRALRPAGRHKVPHLLGITPQIAMGIDAMAAPGEVLVSLDTQRTLRGTVESEPAGDCTLPYASSPIPLHRLLRTPQRSGRGAMTGPSVDTPFIGRAAQLDELFDAWALAQAGRPVAVCVHGEPGIGKSRLVRELRRHAPIGRWLESRCVPENQATPLAPLIDLLNGLDEPLETVLEKHGFGAAETVPLFTALLSRPTDDRYQPLGLSAERQKEQTLTVLVGLLLRIAEATPTAFVLEDLQWADPTTLELVDQLVREVHNLRVAGAPAATRLCVILTTRPELTRSWPADDLTMLPLSRLSEREVAGMITAALTRGGPVPQSVVDEVVRRADGIPLFVEEVTRVLAESGMLPPAGHAAGNLQLQIPGTLRDLLMARLDGLSQGAKETAQVAGVLGREFRYEMLRAVSTTDATELRENLSELQTAGLILHRRSAREETYVFRHALLRDAVYESLVRAVREPLHRRVALTLRECFPQMEQQRPETLARHFEHGGEIDSAVDYWHQAGSRALHRAAYQEALALLQRGLGLIADGLGSPERGRRKVQLLSTLGTVQISTNGYSSVEVEQTFARAWDLCGEIDGEIPTDVVYGLWGVHITRSSREGTAALIPRLRQIIERTDDPVSVLTASACLGTAQYWQGQFASARNYFEEARRLFDTREFQQFAQTFGYGVGLYSYAFGQLTLWLLGYPDQADAVRCELLSIAERVRDPYCTAVALGFAMTLAHDRDEPAVELDFSDRLSTLAHEQRLPVWVAIAQIGRGGAFARLGGGAEAIAPLTEGLLMLRHVGVMCSYGYFLTYLAEAYLDAGRLAEAAATLGEGCALCGTLVARPHEPELLRLHGEMLLRRDGLAGENPALVESWYQRALTLARATGAKAYELRIALSLARLWHDLDRDREARAFLDDVSAWFTEGKTTPDLRAAETLRADLK